MQWDFGEKIRVVFLAVLILTFGIACGRESATAQTSPNTPESKTAIQPIKKSVVKVVFVDKENCCQCTRERTDKSWAALQEVLKGKSANIGVERIHMDKQETEAQKYITMKPIMVVPAIYLLDAQGDLVDMVQGEPTAQDLLKLLGN
jgi:hypothetical protein